MIFTQEQQLEVIKANLSNLSQGAIKSAYESILLKSVNDKYNVCIGRSNEKVDFIHFYINTEKSVNENFETFEKALAVNFGSIEDYHQRKTDWRLNKNVSINEIKTSVKNVKTMIFNCSYSSRTNLDTLRFILQLKNYTNTIQQETMLSISEDMPYDSEFSKMELGSILKGISVKRFKNGYVHYTGITDQMIENYELIKKHSVELNTYKQ